MRTRISTELDLVLRLDTDGGDFLRYEFLDQMPPVMIRALRLPGRAKAYPIEVELESLARLLDEQLWHGPPKDVSDWSRRATAELFGDLDEWSVTEMLSTLGGFGWDREVLPNDVQLRHLTREVRKILETKALEAVRSMAQRWTSERYFELYRRKPVERTMRSRPGRNLDRAPVFVPPGRT